MYFVRTAEVLNRTDEEQAYPVEERVLKKSREAPSQRTDGLAPPSLVDQGTTITRKI